MMRSRIGRRVAFGAYVVTSIAYLVWRVSNTLNPDAPLYSWVFFGLETYAVACAITFYAITLERRDPKPRCPAPGQRVDVFICTYNEPVRLLRRTARRALALQYPHRTWLLDDGRRADVQALARQLGCDYLTRERNTHYKAGNLNNALAHTDGDLVVVLDADHLVRRDLLTKLVGYFDDPRVALVQTPQVFYNIDSFQHHFRARLRQRGLHVLRRDARQGRRVGTDPRGGAAPLHPGKRLVFTRGRKERFHRSGETCRPGRALGRLFLHTGRGHQGYRIGPDRPRRKSGPRRGGVLGPRAAALARQPGLVTGRRLRRLSWVSNIRNRG